MEDQIDLSIVIVNFNTSDYTIQCLDSIAENPPECNYEIVVVDNASTDGSADRLEEQYNYILLIRSPNNRGIAGGNNLGIKASSGRYVLLLNNDTIVNSRSLNAMVEFLDNHQDAGAVGGRLLNPDGSFQAASNKYPTLIEEFMISTRLGVLIRPTYPGHSYSHEVEIVDWIGSACLLLRMTALNQVGLVDEDYFIYGDETDLQYRFSKAGWKIYYLPDVTTIHFGGRSMNRWSRRKMVYRGKILFFQKHYGVLTTNILRAMFCILSILKLLLWGIAYLIPRSRGRAIIELKSNLDVMRLSIKLERYSPP